MMNPAAGGPPDNHIGLPVGAFQPQFPVYLAPGHQPAPDLNTVVVAGPPPTDYPVWTKCAVCKNTGVTNVTYKNGALTWVLCVVLGILPIWPFCLIPFCCNSCKDVEHRCPNCKNLLHVYRRM